MDVQVKAAMLLVISASTFGCADFTTYNSPINLKGGSVSIDAKQRVIYSHKRKEQVYDQDNKLQERFISVICAEPSPDALAVLGASGALSVTEPSGKGGSASSSLSEAASSIGLRTQSIQLLRDLNYRICEAYANGAIHSSEASSLLRRGQSTMMGLIAIEQLTGPILASQAALFASAGAGSAGPPAGIDAAQSAVTTANEQLLTAQAELDTALLDQQTKSSRVSSAAKDLDEAKRAESPEEASIDALKAALQTAQEAAATAEIAVKDKNRRVSAAENALAIAKGRLTKAELAATNTSSIATSDLQRLALANKESTEALANVVRDIVADINSSYVADNCLSFVFDTARTVSIGDDRQTDAASEATISNGDDRQMDAASEATKRGMEICEAALRNQALVKARGGGQSNAEQEGTESPSAEATLNEK